ncbi:hypothetical protein G6M89_06265 [Natronolimnobius sp. AArcel1]|uniref:hypothetical protein n=1 Tax=Natronolimnobius sp. AArcel1 TaxID=1679093 RepID=UPI0013EC8888|nr:hypothetical protein [Natronolimnobius sp. AArcel1]NGM68616.1 hypothetical protein [Natronolimnobius sp. AArcel1]
MSPPASDTDPPGETRTAASPDSDADSAATASPRRSWFRRVGLAAVAVLLVTSVLMRSSVIDSGSLSDPASVLLAGTAVLVLLAVLWSSRSSSDETPDQDQGRDRDGDDGGDSSVWNAIPSWQYGGRHVESGGLARGEQEQALQEIQEQADELEESPRE